MLVLIALMSGFILGQSLPNSKADDKEDPGPMVTAVIRVPRPQPMLLSEPHSKMTDSEFAIYQRTQAALIKTRLVLNAALDNPRVAQLELLKQQADPIAWLKKSLKVERLDDTELMRISLAGKNSADLATLVNAVVVAYIRESNNAERSARQQRLRHFETSRERLEALVRAKRDAIRNYVEETGDPATAEQQSLLVRQELADYWKERTRVRIAKIAVQAKLARPPSDKPADPAGQKVKMEQLEEQLVELQAQEVRLDKAIDQLAPKNKRPIDRITELQGGFEAEEQILKRLQSEIASLNIEIQAPTQVIDPAAVR